MIAELSRFKLSDPAHMRTKMLFLSKGCDGACVSVRTTHRLAALTLTEDQLPVY